MAFHKKVLPTFVVSGTVEKISERDTGQYTQVSLLVNGEWYGKFNTTKADVTLAEGDEVSLVATQNGKYKNWESYTVVSSAPAPDPAAPGTTVSGTPFNTTQYRITYQAARNAAVEVAAMLLSKDLLPIPTVKSKQVGAVMEFIRDVTNDFVTEAWDASPDNVGNKVTEKVTPEMVE